jgi:hypothetical protein
MEDYTRVDKEPKRTKYLNRVFLLNCQASNQPNLGGAERKSIDNSVILIGFYELELFLGAMRNKVKFHKGKCVDCN